MSGARLTEEQSAPLDVRGASVALSAGAGCGKTTVLTERFVRAVENRSPHTLRSIVALTFTNKAARELRDRVRRRCRERAIREADGPEATRWRAIVRALDAAPIQTIHSFCGSVLRAHAREVGLDPGFRVLEEPVSIALREQALRQTVRRLLSDADADLIELAVDLGLPGILRALGELVNSPHAVVLDRWADRTPEALVEHWETLWDQEFRPRYASDILALVARCRRMLGPVAFGHEKMNERRDRIYEACLELERGFVSPEFLEAIRGSCTIQHTLYHPKKWPSQEYFEDLRAEFDLVKAAIVKRRPLIEAVEEDSLPTARRALQLARMAKQARDAYDRLKRTRGGVDNDDLLKLTQELLRSSPPETIQRLASSVELILVDEFQDTDPVQAEILERLAADGMHDGGVFVVGDYKQSIYRFRGAQPKIFDQYRTRVPQAGRLGLSRNFRSVPGVLDFVNALFASTFTEDGSQLQPGLPLPADSEPAVEFLWAEDPPEEGEKAVTAPDAKERRKQEAKRIARYLKQRIDDGWPVRGRDEQGKMGVRDARPGDVAILLGALSDSAFYEQELANVGLDYHVVGGAGYFSQQEVYDLIHVLTVIEDPFDAVAMAGALRSPFFTLSDEALYSLSRKDIGMLLPGLLAAEELSGLGEADRRKAIRARELLAAWRAIKDSVPVSTLIDRVLDESGYEAAIAAEFLGDRKRANARKLVNMARVFDRQGGFTLADFVERLRSNVRDATREGQAATTDEDNLDIVRIMTIHKSKGLEFPVVVVPDLNRKRDASRSRFALHPELGPIVSPSTLRRADSGDDDDESEPGSLGWALYRWIEQREEDAESLRLLYVATTRARDVLVLSAGIGPSESKTLSPAMKLIDERFDRRFGSCRDADETRTLVRVVNAPPDPDQRGPREPRTSLLELAEMIRRAALKTPKPGMLGEAAPRFVDLHPAAMLPPTARRIDSLLRTVLADSEAFQPGSWDTVLRRAERSQEVAPNRRIRTEVRDRFDAILASPFAAELSRAREIIRATEWTLTYSLSEGSEPIVFGGRVDLLVVMPDASAWIWNFAEAEADPRFERLRLALSARAVGEHTPVRGVSVRFTTTFDVDVVDPLWRADAELPLSLFEGVVYNVT